MKTGEEGREAGRMLVGQYTEHRSDYVRVGSSYNETLLRNDFLNQFLLALGWDVFNVAAQPQHLRDVVHEDVVEVDEEL